MSNQNICYQLSKHQFLKRKLCLRLEEFHRSRQHSTAKTATGWPEISHTPVSLTACNASYCME